VCTAFNDVFLEASLFKLGRFRDVRRLDPCFILAEQKRWQPMPGRFIDAMPTYQIPPDSIQVSTPHLPVSRSPGTTLAVFCLIVIFSNAGRYEENSYTNFHFLYLLLSLLSP
jgi:hypothetical protein